MMKKLILVLGVLALVSCDTTVSIKDIGEKVDGVNLYVVEVDGCEYVRFGRSFKAGAAHKGNCKNQIHEHNK